MTPVDRITRDYVGQIVVDALNAATNNSRDIPRKTLAKRCNLGTHTIDCYYQQINTPNLPAFLRLAEALGPDFVNHILKSVGMTARYINAEKPCHRKLATVSAAVAKEVSEALEDGHVDHQEHAKIEPTIRKAHQKFENYLHAR